MYFHRTDLFNIIIGKFVFRMVWFGTWVHKRTWLRMLVFFLRTSCKCWSSNSNYVRLSSMSYPTRYLLLNLPFDTTYSRLLKSSVNNRNINKYQHKRHCRQHIKRPECVKMCRKCHWRTTDRNIKYIYSLCSGAITTLLITGMNCKERWS